MENLKVEVASEHSVKAVHDLAKENGFTKPYNNFKLHGGWVCLDFENKYILDVCLSQAGFEINKYKTVTIDELRKVFSVKEYLERQIDGSYKLIESATGEHDWIRVPEGAEIYLQGNDFNFFRREANGRFESTNKSGVWHDSAFQSELDDGYLPILWQRPQQPEELPFIDDDPKTVKVTIDEIRDRVSNNIENTLAERQSQYGSFEDVAMTTQKIMDAIKWARGEDELPAPHKEALHMIASKIARIVNGDCNHKDSWHDIGGYAKLIENLID